MSNLTRNQGKVPNPAYDLQELIARLQNDKQSGRYSAARDLGEIGDDRAIEPLIKALSDRNPRVKEMAMQSLGKIGAHSTQQVTRQQVINLLIEKIGVNTALDKAVALGMANFGEDALPYLIPLLSEGNSSGARCAATAISEIGMPALEILAEMLNHPNADIRKEAMSGLRRLLLSDSRVKSVMQSALKNPDAVVRADATYQLGRLKDSAMIPELLVALKVTMPRIIGE